MARLRDELAVVALAVAVVAARAVGSCFVRLLSGARALCTVLAVDRPGSDGRCRFEPGI